MKFMRLLSIGWDLRLSKIQALIVPLILLGWKQKKIQMKPYTSFYENHTQTKMNRPKLYWRYIQLQLLQKVIVIHKVQTANFCSMITVWMNYILCPLDSCSMWWEIFLLSIKLCYSFYLILTIFKVKLFTQF